MTTPVPPSSRLPNVRPATGVSAADADRWVNHETRECLRQSGIKLLKPLGKAGAYGAVFEATDSMQRPLAVKIVKNPRDRESRKRHRRECQVLSSGEIPADLVPYCYVAHKAEVPDDSEWNADLADRVQPFLVMSRIPGREVHEYVGGDRPLTMSERIELVARLFEALARLHECGLVHGDPSPRNVLVEKDHRVRFVDLGGARDIKKVIRSMMSTMAVGGTPGYAPKAQLKGDEQAGVWTDIRAMSAVAFDALTGQRHDETLNADDKQRLLKSSQVPAGVSRIILKGLREPNEKVKVDRSVFSTAEDVLTALRAWQQRRVRARQALLFVPLLLLTAAAFGALWWQRELANVERQWQTVRVLREQIGQLAGHDATGVKELVERADGDLRQIEEQGGGWTPVERRRRLDVAADALRNALDRGRKLEVLLPRYNTLGEILNKIPWHPDARGLTTLRSGLEAEFRAVGQLLDAGDAEQAEPRLAQFASKLIAGWEANERARTAGASRAEFGRLFGAVPARLQSAARYGELKADAAKANELWHDAHTVPTFDLADKSFGSAQQRLTAWLDAEESAEEKSVRLQDAAAQVAIVAEQLLTAQAKNSQLASEIDALKTQIANQSKLNQEDRLARQAAESEKSAIQTKLQEETTQRTAAEAKAAQQATELQRLGAQKQAVDAKLATAQGIADRVPQLEAELKATQDALATERGLSEKMSKAAEQYRLAADKAITDVKAAEAARERAARELASRPPPVVGPSVATLTKLGAGKTAGDLLTLTIKDVPVRFRWCPAGQFQMGSPETEVGRDSDENQVPVTLTQGFWMMETECWQKLWVAVMSAERDWTNVFGKGDQYPVYDVSHEDAVEFGRRVTKLLRDSGQLPGNWEATLPTSAQWEYAARAGTTTRFCFGDDESRLGDYAWYEDNSGGTNHPVGTKKPNAWGLCDLHGSVWEWCADWYDYQQVGGTDPKGPASGSARVYRGGGWYLSARYCRSANRDGFTPGYRYQYLGFRLSLVQSR